MRQPVNASSTNEGAKITGDKKSVKSKKGKTAKQIMTRHITNKNDVITEEEFKDLHIGTEETTDTEHEPVELPKGENHPKDEEKDPSMITPWDVIK